MLDLRRSLASLVVAAAIMVIAAVARAADVGGSEDATVRDGAAISPEFAKQMFERLAPLREPDGCALARLDTTRFRLAIGWTTSTGTELRAELATATLFTGDARRIGPWALAVPDDLARQCPATVAAIERILAEISPPERSLVAIHRTPLAQLNERVLTASFVILFIGTALLLMRELRRRRQPAVPILALVAIWAATLTVQLLLSPRTFLHEYYHVAETISAYLSGGNPPAYGNAGPTLFRLVATLSGRPDDVGVIFLTTAVLSSLAIPAVAILDLTLFGGHWGRALTAAVLLAALPLHLRYAAAEDLLVVLVTFALWSTALAMSYFHTGRLLDALLAAIGLSIAVQTRPEGLFFPAAVAMLLVVYEPRAWRRLLDWRAALALAVLTVLIVPHLLDVWMIGDHGPQMTFPGRDRFPGHLVLLDPAVTPTIYLVVLAVGAVGTVMRRPRVLLWLLAVFVGYSLFALSVGDNPPYNLRTQLLPTCLTVLIAAGVAPLWQRLWGVDQRVARLSGGLALAGLAVALIGLRYGFIVERRDQQLEWAFLEETVPSLPERGRLLSTIDIGGRQLDGFPETLLRAAGKRYELIDVRQTSAGDAPWPEAGDDLLWYQGMFCYFAFFEEPPPRPMSRPCLAVHERYRLEPLAVTEIDAPGYSPMEYAPPPFRIGFFRLRPRS